MKKITLPLLIVWLVATSSAFAMNHSEMNNNMGGNQMQWKSCSQMQNLTQEEKDSLKDMSKEDRMQLMQSKMWSGATMSGSCMNKWKMGDMMKNMKGKWQMMWSWMMMWNNKIMSAVHAKVTAFFDKLDKEVTDNAKKIEILKKIDAKITTILTDSTLSSAKKAVYNHIQHMIQMKIEELDSSDVDLDWLLNING